MDADDIDGIVKILRRLHADRELCRRLSATSTDVMREHYQWAAFRQRLVDAVETALQADFAPPGGA